jgi:hypothetical protein
MDNAVIHKSKFLHLFLYSVLYHPEANSVEEIFSQLKT